MSKAVNVEPLTNAPPQPRYRGLTLPKLRLERVKIVAISA
jgi:hypothetical protein